MNQKRRGQSAGKAGHWTCELRRANVPLDLRVFILSFDPLLGQKDRI